MKRLLSALTGVLALAAFAAPEPITPQNYKPDLSKSDIYLPHLNRIPVSGWWKLKLSKVLRKDDNSDAGERAKYISPDFKDAGWTDELFPNPLNLPIAGKFRQNTWGEIQAMPLEVRNWGGIAWLRRDFQLPAFRKDQKVYIHFGDLRGTIDFYVNGHEVFRKMNCNLTSSGNGPEYVVDTEITKFVKPGRNVIVLRVFHSGKPYYFGISAASGILDLVYVDIREKAFADKILITPQRNLKEIETDILVRGEVTAANVRGWTGEVFEWKSGKKVASMKFGDLHTVHGQQMISGKATIRNAKLWSPEFPFLYGLKIRNAQGKVTGCQRFGMRTFEVSGNKFMLNGKPYFLHGVCAGYDGFPRFTHAWWYALRTNDGEAFAKLMKYTRASNVNHWRIHSCFPYPLDADLMDEYGVMLTSEIAYRQNAIINPVREDFIAVKSYDVVSDNKGNLFPGFQKLLRDKIQTNYSHACVTTFSFGNEICDNYDNPRVNNMLNNIYDLFKKYDKQNRPCTNSSGRADPGAVELGNIATREKLDYLDTHDYTGSLRSTPLYAEKEVFDFYVKTAKKYYKDKMPPIMNGETCYYGNFDCNFFKKYFDSEFADEPNWDAVLYWMNGAQYKKDRMRVCLSGYWFRNDGFRKAIFHNAELSAIGNERILEQQRRQWPDQSGYESLTDFFTAGKAWPLKDIKFEELPICAAFRRVNSPVIAVFDMLPVSVYANEPLKTRVHVINNSVEDSKNTVFRMRFLQNKKQLMEKKLSLGKLPTAEKKIVPVEFVMPNVNGKITMEFAVLDGKRVLNLRSFDFYARKRAETFAPVKTQKKIALYDASAAFGDLKGYSTMLTLKAMKVPFKAIDNFKDLKGIDLLIIGADSIDSTVVEEAGLIRKYAENGGRVLVYEQNFTGRIPFLSELDYSTAGAVEFSEFLRPKHPLFKGLMNEEIRCWDPKDGSVFHKYIQPSSSACLAWGGNTGAWGSTAFGMSCAQIKAGKGDMLFMQLDMAVNANTTPAAVKYMRNGLLVMLDDSTRALARVSPGYARLKVPSLSENKARFISIKDAANMAYADDLPNDGKGGWHDQGRGMDLSAFPIGRNFFGGVPFETLDPAQNGNRSMIVVAKNSASRLKTAVSKEIPVGFKVKRLLILQTGAWVSDDNVDLAEYIIRTKSGKTFRIPLRKGKNIGDWFQPMNQKTSDVDCVWTGVTGGASAGAYLLEWKNPNPDDPVVSIQAKALRMVLGILGITAEIK